jgi:hypothetical protein
MSLLVFCGSDFDAIAGSILDANQQAVDSHHFVVKCAKNALKIEI